MPWNSFRWYPGTVFGTFVEYERLGGTQQEKARYLLSFSLALSLFFFHFFVMAKT